MNANYFKAPYFSKEELWERADSFRDDGCLAYIATGIAKTFDLSSDVIERRLKKEGLWPPQ